MDRQQLVDAFTERFKCSERERFVLLDSVPEIKAFSRYIDLSGTPSIAAGNLIMVLESRQKLHLLDQLFNKDSGLTSVILEFDTVESAIRKIYGMVLELQANTAYANTAGEVKVEKVKINELAEFRESLKTVWKLYGELAAPHIKEKIEQILAERKSQE